MNYYIIGGQPPVIMRRKKTKMSFDEDLDTGTEGEKLAADYIRSKHKARLVFKVPGNYPWFDLVAVFDRGKVKLIEVKSDIKEQETGNIAIEFMHHGRLTGVLISEADWYVVVLHDKILAMKKRDLVEYINHNSFREVHGGDSELSTFLLLPSKQLAEEEWVDVHQIDNG